MQHNSTKATFLKVGYGVRKWAYKKW